MELVKNIDIDDINNNKLINSNKLFNSLAKRAFLAIAVDNIKKAILAGSKIRCLLDELLDKYKLDSNKFDKILKSLNESKEDEIKTMISQTITKISDSKCTHYDLYKLRKLNQGLWVRNTFLVGET